MGAVFARRGIYPLPGQARRVDNAPALGRCHWVTDLSGQTTLGLFGAGREFRVCLKPALGNVDPAILVFFGYTKSPDSPDDGPGRNTRQKDKAKDHSRTDQLRGKCNVGVGDGIDCDSISS